jgi:hypothetical protein
MSETNPQDSLGKEQQELLTRKICDLALGIKDTRLESLIKQLYQELDNKGITFRPGTYLADEWGCPQGAPVIGIPFYLADRKLSLLEGKLTGIEAEDEAEVMMDLRHESGHAFNYAYHLYTKAEWRRLFGPFSRPYQEEYRPIPFSASYVRHLPGWYAQKHPDEDFAETFAVWLTPDSDWREQYAGTSAMPKLLYVEKAAAQYGRKPPELSAEKLDRPVQDLTMTLDQWYQSGRDSSHLLLKLPPTLNHDLKRLFPAGQGPPAADILTVNRQELILSVNFWTGIDRRRLTALVDELIERVKTLDLKIRPEPTAAQLLSVSVFITTLSMNYLYRGQFVED